MTSANLIDRMSIWRSDLTVLQTTVVAVLYIVGARIGQLFAIEPGNVTPVWIPSGVMLALALRFGSKVWLGIFLGAFVGNVWAYFSIESLSLSIRAIASGLMNGVGDVISTVIAAQLIIHFANTTRILSNVKSLGLFLAFGVFAGPLASAIFGVSGLYVFGHIEAAQFVSVFETWWLGDSVGVLIFTPLIIAWLYPEHDFDRRTLIVLVVTLAYACLVAVILFGLFVVHRYFAYGVYLFIPMLFALLFRYGQRLVFSVQAAVLSIAVVATSMGYGPVQHESEWVALIQLQLFAAVFSLILFTIALFNLEKTRSEELLEKRARELEELYRKDSLTGLWNRYRIKEFMTNEINRFRRDKRAFGLLILDIDDFKSINDDYGHLEGDKVLTELVDQIRLNIRNIDFFGRWGGEEFTIIVTDIDEPELLSLGEKINSLIREHHFTTPKPITISIGAAIVNERDTELTLFDRADAALLIAKGSGKDRTVMAPL